MCSEDHLAENIACLIQKKGWDKFSSPVSIEKAKKYREQIPCSELVDDQTLAWMMSQASFMMYQATCWGVNWHDWDDAKERDKKHEQKPSVIGEDGKCHCFHCRRKEFGDGYVGAIYEEIIKGCQTYVDAVENDITNGNFLAGIAIDIDEATSVLFDDDDESEAIKAKLEEWKLMDEIRDNLDRFHKAESSVEGRMRPEVNEDGK